MDFLQPLAPVLSSPSLSASRVECRSQLIWKLSSTSDKGRRRTRFCTLRARLKIPKTNSGKLLRLWIKLIILLTKVKHKPSTTTSSFLITQKLLLESRATPSLARTVIQKCRIIWWLGYKARSRRDRSLLVHTTIVICIHLLMTI